MADTLTVAARRKSPEIVFWKCNERLPDKERNESFVRHEIFIKAHLRTKSAELLSLLERIPVMEDVPGWLLLSFCAATRSNCLPRTVRLELIAEFAAEQDKNV